MKKIILAMIVLCALVAPSIALAQQTAVTSTAESSTHRAPPFRA